MKKLAVDDTQKNTHVYEIDWQPDQLTWSIDGNVMRTLKRSDTYNSTAKQYYYPQTPSRIMLSLWPAGLSSNGEGTIEWAGGLVNWDNTKLMQNGYYYAMFEDVVSCITEPCPARTDTLRRSNATTHRVAPPPRAIRLTNTPALPARRATSQSQMTTRS